MGGAGLDINRLKANNIKETGMKEKVKQTKAEAEIRVRLKIRFESEATIWKKQPTSKLLDMLAGPVPFRGDWGGRSL